MLRSLLGFFGGSAQPAAAVVHVKNFDERLKEIAYVGELPSCFICPINQYVMTNPVMINKDPRHTYEASALAEWKRGNNTCPITRNEIVSITKNEDLFNKIEIFVTCLEKIHKLELEIKNSCDVDMHALEQLLRETDINQQDLDAFKDEQLEIIKQQNANLKLLLAHELQLLIAHAVTIIQSEDKKEQEKEKEIITITNPYLLQFIQLRTELRFWFPDFYAKTSGPAVPDPTPSIFSYFMKRGEASPQIRGLARGLFGIVYHPLAFMAVGRPLLIEGTRLTPPPVSAAAVEEIDEETNSPTSSSTEEYRSPSPGKRHD